MLSRDVDRTYSIGALVAKRSFLESLPPYQGGGDMILSVSFEKTTYNEVPRFALRRAPHCSSHRTRSCNSLSGVCEFFHASQQQLRR